MMMRLLPNVLKGQDVLFDEIQAVKKGMHVVLTGEVVYDSFYSATLLWFVN